jgi:hypothetical protein
MTGACSLAFPRMGAAGSPKCRPPLPPMNWVRLRHLVASQDMSSSAPSRSSADQLVKLAELRDRGVITPDEFEREEAKVLAA